MVNHFDSFEDRKGDTVRIKGKTKERFPNLIGAWLDQARPSTRQYHYVIIEETDPETGDSILYGDVRASKANVTNVLPTPVTMVQFVFKEHQDLEDDLDQLARKIATLCLQRSQELMDRIAGAIDRAVNNKLAEGNNATYRYTDDSALPNVIPNNNE